MLKKIIIALVVIVAGFLVIVALQPSDYRVARTATMAAPAPAVFAHVNNFGRWEDWSPWAKLDPHARVTFDGPTEGVGAVFTWDGNAEVGAGRMTMLESRENEFIRIKTDFVKPMEGTSTAEFTFKPEGERTTVTWAMYGQNNFIAKAMCMFVSMDKIVGTEFEKGLATLKAIVERRS
jgi:hypothetical protein